VLGVILRPVGHSQATSLAYGSYSPYGRDMDKQMPLMDVREALGKRVDAAHFADETTVITKNGEPRAVLVSYEWYRQLTGALEVNHDEKLTKG
jgi:prevent-host-death family protein